ncbi:MAG: LysM peptidoglycan-binding domain-containing protein [Chitinophagaceae bacterium]|nr:LysM peptidoglycan-binding domain-containing protein [Chitinophagaceae bacterium]
MALDFGKLEKLHIVAYRKPDYSLTSIAAPPFFALINPETYTYKYKIEFCDTQAPGTSGVNLKFNKMPPQEFNFDFLFDSTGVIQSIFPLALPVTEQLDIFRHSILQYQGDIHRPYYLKIHWGTLLFKGVLTAMDIEFKLFSPDGSPIRAIARCSFKGSIEENLRLALENRMSPDITHQRIMKKSDRLPLMVKDIYDDQRHYIDVARFNNLDSFRRIADGTEIKLPPVQ